MEGSGEGEREVSWSFPEWQASTFAVDYTNERAVLAVQKWLAVISLEDKSHVHTLRKLGRSNKYDVKAVSWNPHGIKRETLVSTNQQKLDVWHVSVERTPLIQSFKAHSRPVSDISWSFSDANLLVSCAGESFIHVWDIRETRKFKASFKAVAGASLVRWNRLSGNVIASAHDSDIRLWDIRKPTTAWGYLTAHTSRIHDLDWSPLHRNQLTSCSHDSTIKFWDTSSPRDPISTMKTGSHPVWRARNYPMGHSVAMVLVPAAIHGSESRVFLWSKSNVSAPTASLHGHTEPVVEVQWRRKRRGDYQLLTLSKDRTLRLWPISQQLSLDLGTVAVETSDQHDEPHPVELSLMSQLEIETSFGSQQDAPMSSLPPATLASSSSSSLPPPETSSLPASLLLKSPSNGSNFQPQKAVQKLEQEFSLLNTESIPSVTIERMDATQRSCMVCVEQGDSMVRIVVSFPSHYPNGAAPSFIFDKSTSLELSSQQELYRSLAETAQSYVKFHRPCLEPCLRRLTKVMENLVSHPPQTHPPQPPPALQPPLHKTDFDLGYGHLDDEHIPFPRICGARFCSNGMLVSFSCQVKPGENRQTPRSLDKVLSYRSHLWLMGKPRRASSFLPSSQPKGSSGSNLMQLPLSDQSTPSLTVTIRDTSALLPVSYELARRYSLAGSDIAELCTQNATVAAQLGRRDLVQAWSAAALIADSALPVTSDPNFGVPWSLHPFSRQLIHSLFDHYGSLHDVQTLAMLSCIFQLHCQHYSRAHPPPSPPPPLPSPHTPPLPLRGSAGDRLSSSWQDIESEVGGGHIGGFEEDAAQEERSHWLSCRLLNATMICQGDEYRRCYANMLYHWQLLEQRAEVVKYQSKSSADHNKIGFVNICQACGDLVSGPTCKKSQSFSFYCNVCNLSVRGSSTFCLSCGHGGHTAHLLQWFSCHQYCPGGCGCPCLEASGWT